MSNIPSKSTVGAHHLRAVWFTGLGALAGLTPNFAWFLNHFDVAPVFTSVLVAYACSVVMFAGAAGEAYRTGPVRVPAGPARRADTITALALGLAAGVLPCEVWYLQNHTVAPTFGPSLAGAAVLLVAAAWLVAYWVTREVRRGAAPRPRRVLFDDPETANLERRELIPVA